MEGKDKPGSVIRETLGGIDFKTTSFALILASVAVLGVAPFLTENPFYLGVLATISLYGVLAMSWDILSGFTGYLNFGLAFSFGVGGYVAALISTHLGWSPVLGIFVGGLGSIILGFLVGGPSLRLRGHFFIVVTLLLPLATAALLNKLLVDGSIFYVDDVVGSPIFTYAASVIVFASTAVVLYAIGNSNVGLVFKAIRENELAAEASGIRTGRYKILAFSISGFFAGMAGAVYVYTETVASPTDFGLLFSAFPVFMAAVGGMGTIAGPILGAFLLEGSVDFLRQRSLEDARLLIAALLLFAVLAFLPGGIWGTLKRRFKLK